MQSATEVESRQDRPAGQIEADVVDCDLGDGAAILDLKTGTYFSLGETGAFVWNALKGGAGRDEIAEAMAREFDVPRERTSSDLETFLDQLVRAGLVRVDPAGHE